MTAQLTPPNSVLIAGCGDIGRRVAKLYLADTVHTTVLIPKTGQTRVTGIVRSQASANTLLALGISPLIFDLDSGKTSDDVSLFPDDVDTLFYFAPPPSSGKTDTRMCVFLANLSKSKLPNKIVYISTTGVYGDHQGALVTELTPANPSVDRAHRRYDAEQQLRTFTTQHDVGLNILRVGGIYGPQRLPLERIKKRVPMLHAELAPSTNRIHEDDLAAICKRVAEYAPAGEIYNVSDGNDSNMTEYFLTLADYFNLPRPPLVDWDEAERVLSKGMLSYLHESRRVSNKKLINELDVKLQYPDLLAGLTAMGDDKT